MIVGVDEQGKDLYIKKGSDATGDGDPGVRAVWWSVSRLATTRHQIALPAF